MILFYRSLLLAFIIFGSACSYAFEDYSDEDPFPSYPIHSNQFEDQERNEIINGTLDYIEYEHRLDVVPAAKAIAAPELPPTRATRISYESDGTFFYQDEARDSSFPLKDPEQPLSQKPLTAKRLWERILSRDGSVVLTTFCKLGYLSGNTAYDFAHHTSELEYPFDNWMWGVGGAVSVPQYRITLKMQVMGTIDSDAGDQMKDKDWVTPGDPYEAFWPAGTLYSYTRSKAYMQGSIFDINGTYDLVRQTRKESRIRGGIVAGFRYQKFSYEMYDLYMERYLLDTTYEGQTLYPGVKVLGYQIRYRIPYMGVSFDVDNKVWGVGGSVSCALRPKAEDRDDHLLRDLVFFGDYTKNGKGFLGDIYGYYFLTPAVKLTMGMDVTYIAIDGNTYEQSRDPAWDQTQSTDLKQFMLWTGLEYRF